jgi:hypothetical protein
VGNHALVFVQLAHDRRFVGAVLFVLVRFVFNRISEGHCVAMITKGLLSINLVDSAGVDPCGILPLLLRFPHQGCAAPFAGHSFRVALPIREPTLGLTKPLRARLWPTTSCWLRHDNGSANPRIWYSSLADLTP